MTVIPISPTITRIMIWSTAKLTEVNSRHRPRPRRAGGDRRWSRDVTARPAARVAIGIPYAPTGWALAG